MPGKTVFISYSHDSEVHEEMVLGLAERLRQDGIDARIDQYVNGTPEQGWPRWMLDQLDEASHVLVVCTETYYRRFRGHEVPDLGKGGDWEGALITQEIYDARSRTVKFVPVMLAAGQERFIPEPLRGRNHYELTSEKRYKALYRFLRGLAGIVPRPLGPVRPLPKQVGKPLAFPPASKQTSPTERTAPTLPWLLLAVMLAAAVILAIGSLFAAKCISPSGEERTVNGIVYVRICGGTFTMGADDKDPRADGSEMPAHEVKLSEFWIGKTEVTNMQYRRFRPNHQGDDELPVTGVSWYDAKAACEAFGGRLPTEEEWEYAARAGTQTPWSFDDEKKADDYAWYGDGRGPYELHPVATRRPNGWSLRDMHGNAWEWVADRYRLYSTKPDPTSPSGEFHVLRGGAYGSSLRQLRSAFRLKADPKSRNNDFGFRCVSKPR